MEILLFDDSDVFLTRDRTIRYYTLKVKKCQFTLYILIFILITEKIVLPSKIVALSKIAPLAGGEVEKNSPMGLF
jgi:hypothetical protein